LKKSPYTNLRKDHINVRLENGITSLPVIKALGINLEQNMTWDYHINKVLSKTTSTT